MPNGEVIKFPGCAGDGLIDSPNVTFHLPLQIFQEIIHFLVRPLHDQLDPSIRHVPHVTADVILHRQIRHRVPKTDALDAPADPTFTAMSRMGRIVHSANITPTPFSHQHIFGAQTSLHLKLLLHFFICDLVHELVIALLGDGQILAEVMLQKRLYARGVPPQIPQPK